MWFPRRAAVAETVSAKLLLRPVDRELAEELAVAAVRPLQQGQVARVVDEAVPGPLKLAAKASAVAQRPALDVSALSDRELRALRTGLRLADDFPRYSETTPAGAGLRLDLYSGAT